MLSNRLPTSAKHSATEERGEPHQHERERTPAADLRGDLRRHQEDGAADHLVDADRGQIPAPERAPQECVMTGGCIMCESLTSAMHTTLPRRFYADPDFYRARTRALLLRSLDLRRPRGSDSRTRATTSRARSRGESVIVTRDGSGAITRCSTCAGIAARVCASAAEGTSPTASSVRITLDLRLTGRLLAAPHMPPDFCKEDTRCIAPAVRSGTATSSCISGPDTLAQPPYLRLPPSATSSRICRERFAAWQMQDSGSAGGSSTT